MLFALLATLCAGLFAGAAIYITAVEHPARLACGPTIAVKEFALSYHRATVMQASLAIVGCVAGVAAWMRSGNGWLLIGALLLGSRSTMLWEIIQTCASRIHTGDILRRD